MRLRKRDESEERLLRGGGPFHEVDRRMQPIEEYGKGHGRPYGVPDPQTGKAARTLLTVKFESMWERPVAMLRDELEINAAPDLNAQIVNAPATSPG